MPAETAAFYLLHRNFEGTAGGFGYFPRYLGSRPLGELCDGFGRLSTFPADMGGDVRPLVEEGFETVADFLFRHHVFASRHE